jgi:ubiquitin fusion degradation protein 1
MFGGGGFFGGGDVGGFFGGGVPGRFDHQYQAFPVSFAGKEELEKGNKMILPQSALDHLARLNISYPMLFEVQNPGQGRTHAGVQEFIAEEGMCYLPYWMMCNLCLQEGDLVRITNTSLPKGSFVKLQPVSSEFLDIHNPRAVLENSLRNFATLTVGDCIVIDYNQKKYEIEIVECKPAQAISIIEADVNVDFAPPKDYKEPERPMADAGSSFKAKVEESEAVEPAPEEEGPKLFGGSGQRVDGKAIKTPQASPAIGPKDPPNIEDELDEKMPWRKKLQKGIKWVNPPYGFNSGHMSAQKGAAPPPKPVEDLWKGGGNKLQ